MKKIFLLIFCLIFVFCSVACQSANNRAVEGAAIGGIIGAAAGGIIGHQSRHGAEGAAIGAAAGALTGAIAGSQIKKPDQSQAPMHGTQAQASYANPNQMSLQEVVELSRQGVHEAVIIDKLRLTNSRFNLAGSDIEYLKQQGVSQRVIEAMQGF